MFELSVPLTFFLIFIAKSSEGGILFVIIILTIHWPWFGLPFLFLIPSFVVRLNSWK